MEDQVDFLNLPPLHTNSLTNRLNLILQLKEHINYTTETFEQYSDVGLNLCKCMEKLSGSFTCYQEFQSDPTLRSISNLLDSFQSTLKNHYLQIEDLIIKPLIKFVKTDIREAEEKAKRANQNVDNYFRNVENYVALKKKNTNELQEIEGRLMASHWQAVESDFSFHRALDLVERKKLIEITATVCFLESAVLNGNPKILKIIILYQKKNFSS
ncbi:hypothetical protein TRFO_31018 [Tritrichomonas foetus]|uniref:BAR domain-containing protein n=1 Tax=Tritrichomonas foetus TaxID=1144522 RepID=A0A1J4JS83_9EUKA|nr:hypothetical protein TRFO_31018 [Tritrichomonas foetus]|eukprot:OHT01999.1 hypothetical protein TRFO_31018 [Tritrichomonas foetus]